MSKYDDNLELIRRAIRCEPVERIPVGSLRECILCKEPGRIAEGLY